MTNNNDWFKPIGDDKPLDLVATKSKGGGWHKNTSYFHFESTEQKIAKAKLKAKKARKTRNKVKAKKKELKKQRQINNPANAAARETARRAMQAYEEAQAAGVIPECPYF